MMTMTANTTRRSIINQLVAKRVSHRSDNLGQSIRVRRPKEARAIIANQKNVPLKATIRARLEHSRNVKVVHLPIYRRLKVMMITARVWAINLGLPKDQSKRAEKEALVLTRMNLKVVTQLRTITLVKVLWKEKENQMPELTKITVKKAPQ